MISISLIFLVGLPCTTLPFNDSVRNMAVVWNVENIPDKYNIAGTDISGINY
jgi:hypothetical protein